MREKKEIKIKSICRKNSRCIAMFCILDGLVESVWFCPSSVLVEYTALMDDSLFEIFWQHILDSICQGAQRVIADQE